MIEYWDGVSFKEIDVVSPRYYRPSLEAVRIPREAIGDGRGVHIRVTATKRHRVQGVALCAPQKKMSPEIERFSPSRVFLKRENKDYAGVVSKKYSGEYLHTIPADVVDVSFPVGESVQKEGTQVAYVIEAGGVYTPASRETQQRAGDWVSKLDGESRAVLDELYALKTDAGR